MRGIDRLRALAGAWDAYGLGGALMDVADEIERERACDEDAIENVLLIVGGVVDEMERHVSGVEGADDSPVARWARELRRALKSDTSDAAEQQKPSCADPAEAADVTSEAQKVTRDPADDVSMSAYDLLPEEEREAIAWVREHGGLERVKAQRRESMPRAAYERKKAGFLSHIAECERALRRRNQRIEELGHRASDLTAENAELRKRAMPDGMEWLVEAWPRFEDDAPVRLLDDFERYGEENDVRAVTMYPDGSFALNCRAYSKGERVNRPAPNVLDADGVEIRVGDTVWDVEFGCENVVTKVSDSAVFVAFEGKSADRCDPASLTHRAPVIAADGRPLREGETVYKLDDDRPYTLKRFDGDHVSINAGGSPFDIWTFPNKLTHERPDSWERIEEDAEKDPCGYFGFDGEEPCGKCPASGKNCEQQVARDLVRRCRALAERERGE